MCKRRRAKPPPPLTPIHTACVCVCPIPVPKLSSFPGGRCAYNNNLIYKCVYMLKPPTRTVRRSSWLCKHSLSNSRCVCVCVCLKGKRAREREQQTKAKRERKSFGEFVSKSESERNGGASLFWSRPYSSLVSVRFRVDHHHHHQGQSQSVRGVSLSSSHWATTASVFSRPKSLLYYLETCMSC